MGRPWTPQTVQAEERMLGSCYLDLQNCNFVHYGITTAHMQTAFMKLLSGKEARSIDLPAKLVCESDQAGRVLTPEDAVSGQGRRHEGEGDLSVNSSAVA